MAWYAYLALLAAWLLFVAPALGRVHAARGWARAAAALGCAAALYEAWMSLVWGPTVVGPIRIDIFAIFAVLAAVYLLTGLRLYRAGWRAVGLAAGALSMAAGAAMAVSLALVGQEMARVDSDRREANRLLFAAKFADQAAYDEYFGGADAAQAGIPVGHWEGQGSARYTRLVVGGDGRAYLFFRCDDTECQFGPGSPLEPRGDGFVAHLVWSGVGERSLELDAVHGDSLALRIDGNAVQLERTPPPLAERPRRERLAYLGAYSALEPIRQHVRASQLWLWRGEEGLFAVGVFRILLPGRRADFVRPVALGRGRRDGDVWQFAWLEDGEPREARVRLLADGHEIELALPGRGELWPTQRLAAGGIFHDEVVELASRGSAAEWAHWFEHVLTAHFTSAEIPAR